MAEPVAIEGDTDVAGLRLASARGRAGLTATVVASSMAMLDGTVVNVALPHIGEDLGADVSGLQWVVTGYLLSLASLILLGGALGDRLGRRRVFVTGTVWFAVASLACAVAPTANALVAARVVQGIGGALLTPGSLALLQAGFRPADRARAVGAWSGLGGVAAAVGPFAGGWIVDGPGWRWVFLLNLPLAALVLLTAPALPESRDEGRRRRFDLLGTVLGVVGLVLLTWALTEAGRRGWGAPAVVVPGAAALLVLAAFVAVERRRPYALVPVVLFRSRTFTVLNAVTFTLYGALGGMFFLVVYDLQVASGWSALAAGAALVPATLLMLFGSSASGALAQRIGPRLQLVVGPALVAVAALLLGRAGTDASWARDVLPGALVFGLGLVAFVAPLTASVMATAPPAHVSIASGVNNAVARTASLAAVAFVPVVAGLPGAGDAAEVADAYATGMLVVAALAASAALTAAALLPAREAVSGS